MDYDKAALDLHRAQPGKLAVSCTVPLETADDLCTAYTPGVAAPCRAIAQNPDEIFNYTCKGNLVAVVSDGSAVLGLGNIGARAAMPVMEGKAALLKRFGGVDAIPLCLDTQDPDELVATVKNIAPCFGAILLEDISSPRCFSVERRLEGILDIPVFHDDQHGTAIVVLAALLNAARVTGRNLADMKIVVNGPGAAGTAIIRMLLFAGVKDIIACDEYGILYKERGTAIVDHKKELCEVTNLTGRRGTLADALKGADAFIGVSVAGALRPAMIAAMAPHPIVLAMANHMPEISYAEAVAAGAAVVGTGRSDAPNQVNNVLVFPGLFRGALDARAIRITYDMKLAAARAVADLVPAAELRPEHIIPPVLDPRVAPAVAKAVADSARAAGLARL